MTAQPLQMSAQYVRDHPPRRGLNVAGRHVWTAADEAVLRDGFARGIALDLIAAQLGVTVRSVEGHARKLWLFHRSRPRRGPNVAGRHVWTAADEAVLRDGYDRGIALDLIAAQLGVTVRSVEGHARKLWLFHYSRTRTIDERFWSKVRPDPGSGLPALDRRQEPQGLWHFQLSWIVRLGVASRPRSRGDCAAGRVGSLP